MNYKEKVPRLIDKYLFDAHAELLKDQFEDLDWKPVIDSKNPFDSIINLEAEEEPKAIMPPKGNKEYLAVWRGGLGTQDQVDIMTADEIHSFNSQTMMVYDHGYMAEYVEIPSKDYFFNKLYKDEYKSIEDATTGLLKKYNNFLKEQEESQIRYNKKWEIIDHASFFAVTKLAFPLKIDLTLNDIPVVFEDKQVGTAVLVEYKENKSHFAIKLDPSFGHFDHTTIGKSYDVDYQIECKDEDDQTYIVDVKKVILIKR